MSIKFYFLSLRAFAHTYFLSLSNLNTSDSSPGGGEYSWEFLVGLCSLVIQILTQFQTKKCHFPHPFSDLEVTEIMSPLQSLEHQQKDFFLSFFFIYNWNNEDIQKLP